jgi:hypothetical protein
VTVCVALCSDRCAANLAAEGITAIQAFIGEGRLAAGLPSHPRRLPQFHHSSRLAALDRLARNIVVWTPRNDA